MSKEIRWLLSESASFSPVWEISNSSSVSNQLRWTAWCWVRWIPWWWAMGNSEGSGLDAQDGAGSLPSWLWGRFPSGGAPRVFLHHQEGRFCDSKERNLKYFRDSDFALMNVVCWVRQINIFLGFFMFIIIVSGLAVGSFPKPCKNPCKFPVVVLTSDIRRKVNPEYNSSREAGLWKKGAISSQGIVFGVRLLCAPELGEITYRKPQKWQLHRSERPPV